MENSEMYSGQNIQQSQVPMTPPGLQAIYNACRRLYPDQPNPLQVTAVVKYWLGGPDPLDYISMYANGGDQEQGVPPHWHYVTFGLSDLHGDGRVHEFTGGDGNSGFGFELTFRLKRESGETAPPTWPAQLMQALARYVFQSVNTMCAGDHIPWHNPLDGSESRIQHMILSEDPQLKSITTSLGAVSFIQIVGVCAEELKAAQHWNGAGVLEMLKQVPLAGGTWLITDMRRGETIFELNPQIQDQVDQGIESQGSNLSGVTGKCSWDEPGGGGMSRRTSRDEDKENQRHGGERRSSDTHTAADRRQLSKLESEQIVATLKKGLYSTHPVLPPIRGDRDLQDDSQDSQQLQNKNRSRKESFDSNISSEAPTELLRTRILDCVHIKFNLEAAQLISLALRGRLRHGRHFTFKSVVNDTAITFVSSSVSGAFVDEQHPYAAHGPWLQVLLTEDFMEEVLDDMSDLSEEGGDNVEAPKTYNWPGRKVTITVVPGEA